MLVKVKKLEGYKLDAIDGELGKVKEFYFDDQLWEVRFLIADTGNWLTGKQVLISPKWIDHISWEDLKVFVNLSSEEIRLAPEYSEEDMLTRDYKAQLHKYYKRNVYWNEKPEDRLHFH